MRRIGVNLPFTWINIPSLLMCSLLAWSSEATAATYHVAPSGNDAAAGTNWATAVQTIQAAVDKTIVGDTVIVSNGVYQTGGRVAVNTFLSNRVVIDKPIIVQSVNGPAVTIIRGAKDPINTNGTSAVRCVWLTNGATLVGFTLTNGATRSIGDFVFDHSGGGVWAQSTNAVVNHCTLTGNSASFGGGARSGTLNHCTLTGNSADEGGGVYGSTLNNCMLTGNSASDGGGAFVSRLNNCTLTGNSADIVGGGAHLSMLNNCIIYFNITGNMGANHLNSTINYTCTTPMPVSGTGNITNDPLFVSLAATNLQLSTGSPARDMGNNAYSPSGPDFAGNLRIVHTFVDMGAYEFQDSPPGDYDGDGISTTDERVVGSDPLNADDVWGILEADTAGSLTFNTLLGRLYTVDSNDDLVAEPQIWTPFTNNIPGTGGPITITDPLPGTNRNYRVRVDLAQ